MASDKRKLELEVKVDDKATKPLKSVGNAADGTKDDLSELNAGLKKLDDSTAATTATIAKLRAEIAKSGDLELIKDLDKQERRLKAFARQRKLLTGDDGVKVPIAEPDPEDARKWGVQFAARLGPVLVNALPSALTSGGGAGAAIGAPIVAGLAAWLSTAAVGAVLGGAAVGAVAGGIKLAARDSRVQAAGAELSASIGTQLESAAEPFVPATLRAIGKVRAGFRDLDDELEDIFGISAGYVDPLTDALVGLAKRGVEGFRDLVRGARPVVAMLRQELPELGDDIGDSLSKLSEHGPEAARALGMLLNVAGTGIKIVAQGLSVASTAFKIMDLAAASMRGPQHLAETAAGYYIAAKQAEDGTWDWSEALKGLEEKAGAAAVEVQSLHESVSDIVDQNLSAAEATLRAAEAFDAATEAVDGTKRVTRDERQALIDLAQALNASTAALDAQGVSAIQSAEHHESNRRKIMEAARAAGYTREQAAALADQWLKIPRNVTTTVNARTAAAKNALSAVRNTLDALDGRVANASVYISAYNKNARGMSSGGPVDGPGPKGVDSVPAVLAPGEYVLDTKTVDRLGGPAAVAAWHRGGAQQARALMASVRPTGPGPMSGSAPTYITVNVNAGWVANPRELEDRVTQGLMQALRTRPDLRVAVRAAVV